VSARLLLLDGTALVYRAYYALLRTPLTNSRGEPTAAVLGFANTLQTLLRQQKPEYLGVVFDAPGRTFRDEMYAEYKATRSPMPGDLAGQLPWIRDLVDAWPAARLEVSGVEADDVIGSYVTQLASPEMQVIMVSGDKDMYQLLSPHVSLLNPGRGGPAAIPQKLIGPDDVREKFGVDRPDQVRDVLALMGDSSDNVPGVPGVGAKTAAKLIEEHGSLEKLYENLHKVSSARIRANLEAHRDTAFLARDLVLIKTDVPLPVGLDGLAVRPPGSERLAEILRDLEFKNLIEELMPGVGGVSGPVPETRPAEYRLVEDLKGLKALAADLAGAGSLAVAVHADPGAPPAGIGLAWDGEQAYVNVNHAGGRGLGSALTARVLGPVLAGAGPPKTGHDLKTQFHALERMGASADGVGFDTMIASYVLSPERSHQLDSLASTLLGRSTTPLAALTGKGAKRVDATAVPAAESGAAAAEAAGVTLDLAVRFGEELDREGMVDLYRDVEIPLVDVLRGMENTGIRVDAGFLAGMSRDMEKQLARLEKKCHDLAEVEFNVNSPSQLAEILFERLQLPRGKKIKTGYSTDSEVLEGLRSHHALPEVVLEYRLLSKLKSTYVDTLPTMIAADGRVHGTFHQTVAATGRLSSSDPNLQNIPIRTEIGREVRRAFVPGHEGWVLVSADYSQIELRIMAHLSRDPVFVDAFRRGVDVHRDTASRLFGVAPGDVTDAQRGQAKTVNFGILYGQGAFGLARTLGIGNAEASAFIREYKTLFSGVVDYLEGTLAEAREKGYVTTLLGRRRFLPQINASGAARAAAERLAINAPIQGSAADLIKVAMIRVHRRLAREHPETKLLLTVHDELLLEAPEHDAEAAADAVREEMEQAMVLDVPVVVNVGIGANWAEIH